MGAGGLNGAPGRPAPPGNLTLEIGSYVIIGSDYIRRYISGYALYPNLGSDNTNGTFLIFIYNKRRFFKENII